MKKLLLTSVLALSCTLMYSSAPKEADYQAAQKALDDLDKNIPDYINTLLTTKNAGFPSLNVQKAKAIVATLSTKEEKEAAKEILFILSDKMERQQLGRAQLLPENTNPKINLVIKKALALPAIENAPRKASVGSSTVAPKRVHGGGGTPTPIAAATVETATKLAAVNGLVANINTEKRNLDAEIAKYDTAVAGAKTAQDDAVKAHTDAQDIITAGGTWYTGTAKSAADAELAKASNAKDEAKKLYNTLDGIKAQKAAIEAAVLKAIADITAEETKATKADANAKAAEATFSSLPTTNATEITTYNTAVAAANLIIAAANKTAEDAKNDATNLKNLALADIEKELNNIDTSILSQANLDDKLTALETHIARLATEINTQLSIATAALAEIEKLKDPSAFLTTSIATATKQAKDADDEKTKADAALAAAKNAFDIAKGDIKQAATEQAKIDDELPKATSALNVITALIVTATATKSAVDALSSSHSAEVASYNTEYDKLAPLETAAKAAVETITDYQKACEIFAVHARINELKAQIDAQAEIAAKADANSKIGSKTAAEIKAEFDKADAAKTQIDSLTAQLTTADAGLPTSVGTESAAALAAANAAGTAAKTEITKTILPTVNTNITNLQTAFAAAEAKKKADAEATEKGRGKGQIEAALKNATTYITEYKNDFSKSSKISDTKDALNFALTNLTLNGGHAFIDTTACKNKINACIITVDKINTQVAVITSKEGAIHTATTAETNAKEAVKTATDAIAKRLEDAATGTNVHTIAQQSAQDFVVTPNQLTALKQAEKNATNALVEAKRLLAVAKKQQETSITQLLAEIADAQTTGAALAAPADMLGRLGHSKKAKKAVVVQSHAKAKPAKKAKAKKADKKHAVVQKHSKAAKPAKAKKHKEKSVVVQKHTAKKAKVKKQKEQKAVVVQKAEQPKVKDKKDVFAGVEKDARKVERTIEQDIKLIEQDLGFNKKQKADVEVQNIKVPVYNRGQQNQKPEHDEHWHPKTTQPIRHA